MELFEVIGIEHKTGTYQGQPFDNMIFSCTRPAETDKGEIGIISSRFKVKTRFLTSIPSVGDTVSPIYDRFGNCIGFQD